MLVSIITPSYNQGRFIEDTIKSVLEQPGEFSLEYVVMDGGSTDGTVEILKKYDRLLSSGSIKPVCASVDFKWTSARDAGQADAINMGFKAAKGDVVAWLNADDTYLPGAIEKAHAHFLKNPACMMVYGRGYEADESGGNAREFAATRAFDLDALANVWDYILQPAVFMRKKAVEDAGYLDARLHWCMDWDLWIRIGKKYRVDFISEFLAVSRVYGETKTSTGGWKRYAEICSVLKRHGTRVIPPGYFVYGFDLLLSVFRKNAPSAHGLMKRAFSSKADGKKGGGFADKGY